MCQGTVVELTANLNTELSSPLVIAVGGFLFLVNFMEIMLEIYFPKERVAAVSSVAIFGAGNGIRYLFQDLLVFH